MPYIRVKGDRRYLVTEPHPIMWVGRDGRTYRLTVPIGFVLDAGSVPWFGRPLIPGDWTLGVEPILFHDFVYHRRGRFLPHEFEVRVDGQGPELWMDAQLRMDGLRDTMARRECDRIWRDMMVDEGVRRVRARVAYRAVRLAVWKSWPEGAWEYHGDT